ncbi:MAG: amidohydrolase family protein [Chloroflexota bacterium]|nr:amidohydrolase family protein [Chloroflexota bacterium]
MKIIDSHCHLGISKLSGHTITESDLLHAMDTHGVDISLVMPHAVTDDPVAAHDAVAELCQKHPGRFRGIVNLSPLWDEANYRREATRCVRDLGFVALKLNPMQHLTSPLMANADKVFDAAADLGVPVVVHTGPGVPWALPALSIPQARRHPDLPIILAHAGFAVYTAEAYVAAVECDNIFLEPSWCAIYELKWLIKELGADRILFGSDLPENLPVELVKYKSLDLSLQDLAACLGGTAARLFQI